MTDSAESEEEFSTALEQGLSSPKFVELCAWLVQHITGCLNMGQSIFNQNDSETFLLELKSFLDEIGMVCVRNNRILPLMTLPSPPPPGHCSLYAVLMFTFLILPSGALFILVANNLFLFISMSPAMFFFTCGGLDQVARTQIFSMVKWIIIIRSLNI